MPFKRCQIWLNQQIFSKSQKALKNTVISLFFFSFFLRYREKKELPFHFSLSLLKKRKSKKEKWQYMLHFSFLIKRKRRISFFLSLQCNDIWGEKKEKLQYNLGCFVIDQSFLLYFTWSWIWKLKYSLSTTPPSWNSIYLSI